jgi:RNA polymerase sigma-70 factor, ECF subfamily
LAISRIAEHGEQRLMSAKPDAGEQLLIEAAQKDPRRFADLYEANFERVYAYVARRVRERADAEDVTAEVFHQALANLHKFEWRGTPFSAWLFRIASNAISDRWQRTAREIGNPSSALADDPRDPRDSVSPEQIEERARLFRLVAGLPADQRSVIEMRFSAGKSIAEIAHDLRRSDGAVKQLQFRAIRSLRNHWQKPRRKRTRAKHG